MDDIRAGLIGTPTTLSDALGKFLPPDITKTAIEIGINVIAGGAGGIGKAVDDLPKLAKSLKNVAEAAGDAIRRAKGAVKCADDAGWKLAPNTLPALRQAYVTKVGALKDTVAQLRAAGKTPEEIARTVSQIRRDIGIEFKNLTPADKLAEITARNLAKYGDELGPTIDWLRARGKSWEQIIESATRPGGGDLGF